MSAWLRRPTRHPVLWIVVIITAYSMLPALADAAVALLGALQ